MSLNLNMAHEQTFKGFFWEIDAHDGNIGYLLGSIHLASDHLLDPEGKIMECFKRSRSLALETDFTGDPLWNFEAIKEIQIDEVNIQFKQLNQEDKARLVKNTITVINAIGHEIPANDSVNNNPHVILQLINFIYAKSSKGLSRNGMESKLANLAKGQNFLIYDLENTEAYQRKRIQDFFKEGILWMLTKKEIADPSLWKGLPAKLDEMANHEYLEMKAGLEKAGTYENWKIGNLEYFEIYNRRGVPRGFRKEQSKEQLSDDHRIRKERNREMAEKLMVLIKEGKTPFAAIGARHTVGAGFKHMQGAFSVLEYLKEAGCKITRISVDTK